MGGCCSKGKGAGGGDGKDGAPQGGDGGTGYENYTVGAPDCSGGGGAKK